MVRILKRSLALAKRLVRDNAAVIERVAAVLLARGRLSDSEVSSLMRET
jgi:hypothetical protein